MLTPCRPSSGQNVIKEDDTDRCISPESLHIINDISVHSLKLACTRETVWVYCFSLLTWIKLVVMGLTLSFIDFFNAKKGKMFFFFLKHYFFFFFNVWRKSKLPCHPQPNLPISLSTKYHLRAQTPGRRAIRGHPVVPRPASCCSHGRPSCSPRVLHAWAGDPTP